jgi:DHA1 family bicyclomycin/chloramphenicol resistance-like MFS transporter
MSQPTPSYSISTTEFIILIAFLMSVIAISIDALLPALGVIRQDLMIEQANQAQLLISAIFLGMAIGQLISGPLSDATGRKKILYIGVGLFLIGSVMCFLAEDLNTILIGRFIQGLGVSGPYVSAMSIVRDQYSGSQMAKIMSIVMLIFMGVPAIAPSLGQGILLISDWRSIFIFYIVYAVIICTWIFLRLEESLPKEKRIGFSVTSFAAGFKEVLTNRVTLGYTLSMGLFFGSMIGYLNSSQQIFQVQFNTGKMFTVYFGLLALAFGASSLANSFVVVKLGMQRICNAAVKVMIAASAVFLLLHNFIAIELWMFLIFAGLIFFCFGFIFGNINAIAMEPMGHVAGIASAIIGSVSSIIALVIGTAIGQAYDNTLIPVTWGFLILSSLAYVIMQLSRNKTPLINQEEPAC